MFVRRPPITDAALDTKTGRYLLLTSERSERDAYRGNTIENRGCSFVCIMFERKYVILYFDPLVLSS